MELYDVEQTAKLLNLSPLTIRKWLRSEKIKGTKIGKEWRISTDELRRLFPEARFFIDFPEVLNATDSPDMKENKQLAKELYPERYSEVYWREEADPWGDFGEQIKEEVQQLFPYPFKADEIAYYNQDKTDYLEGGDPSSWEIYYSLKLKDEQKRFDTFLSTLKEKYGITEEEMTKLKQSSYGLHLLMCVQPLYEEIG